MIVVELDKYSEENFYKQPANSPNADSPDNITHARLYYDTFAGSNYIQGDFVEDSNSTVEFDNSGIGFVLFKLFLSSDGVTYTENKSFGGSEGKDCVTSQQVIDPATYDDWDIVTKVTTGDIEQFVPKSLSEVIAGAGISVTSSAVDYLYCRGVLVQHNDIDSGKAFFGSISVNQDTGVREQGVGSPQVTIADSFSRSLSARVSTGIYKLQFRTSGANNFVESLAGFYQYKFEPRVYTVWGSRQVTFIADPDTGDTYFSSNVPEVKGYLVLDNKEYFTGYSVDGVPLSSGYYQNGQLIVKTYNTSWALADNIIEQGVTIEIRAFANLTA